MVVEKTVRKPPSPQQYVFSRDEQEDKQREGYCFAANFLAVSFRSRII